jgi:hypothetical protein
MSKECVSCREQKPLELFAKQYSNKCKHKTRSLCDDCMVEGYKNMFREKMSTEVRCLELGCYVEFDHNEVKNILEKKAKNFFDRYTEFLLQSTVEQMPEFIWCAHSCGSGQLNECGKSNPIVICVNCKQKTCFIHKCQWHTGLTCWQYDMQRSAEEKLNEEWIVKNTKCPKCLYHIEKDGGCDHMTCRKCSHEFCWYCMSDFEPIRRDRNHRHNTTCRYYFPLDV